VNFVRNPGVYLAVLIENAFGSNQAGSIEDMTRPFRIDFQHGSTLNVDIVRKRLFLKPAAVLIRDFDCQFVDQLTRRFKTPAPNEQIQERRPAAPAKTALSLRPLNRSSKASGRYSHALLFARPDS